MTTPPPDDDEIRDAREANQSIVEGVIWLAAMVTLALLIVGLVVVSCNSGHYSG